MDTLFVFVEFILGFVPLFGGALILAIALFAATKLFPRFGAKMDALFDGLFGVDEEYDRKHNTGYATRSHPNRW